MHLRILFYVLPFVASMYLTAAKAQPKEKQKSPTPSARNGTVVIEKIQSEILRENRVGLETTRGVTVYLPPGYSGNTVSYPVVYFFHNLATNPTKVMAEGKVAELLDRAIAAGIVKPFIFVMADYSTATTGSFYENSVVSGRWIDFTTKELVPFIDARFRTLQRRDGRALTGHYLGGRAALKLAMDYPDMFSVVYALHPVALGTGYVPWSAFGNDWKKILTATSPDELKGNFIVALNQAFLPNPTRPPFYCDFFMELENGEPKLHPEHTIKAQKDFHLDRTLEERAANLRSLRGLAYDWARYDSNQDHVYAAQSFTRQLDNLGIPHEAEEYRGNPFDKNWTEHGRFYTRLLPFLATHLAFEQPQ